MNPSPNPNELEVVGAHLKGLVAVCMLWRCRSHQLMPPAVAAVRGRPRAWLRCWNAPASAARRGLTLAGAARDSGERGSPVLTLSSAAAGLAAASPSFLPLAFAGGERGSGEGLARVPRGAGWAARRFGCCGWPVWLGQQAGTAQARLRPWGQGELDGAGLVFLRPSSVAN
jgi:hypothetical protein